MGQFIKTGDTLAVTRCKTKGKWGAIANKQSLI